MASPDKVSAVAELTDAFRESDGAVLTEYRGLSVKQLQELRRSLGENVSYAVAKNTLTKIAAKEAGLELDEALLTGPTAIAFIKGDPVEAAKGLRNFAKDNDALVLKGGFLDGKPLDADEIKKLADLESREVLLAKLAGALKGGLYKAAGTINAPLAQAARLFGALEAKGAAAPSGDADHKAEEDVVEAAAPADAPEVAEDAPVEETVAEAAAEETPVEAPAETASESAADAAGTEG